MTESGKNEPPPRLDGRAAASSESAESLKTRLDQLSTRLDSLQEVKENHASTRKSNSGLVTSSAFGLGTRVMGEFVGAIVVGGAVGWASDRLFGTAPVFLVIFLGVGTAAGFWSVYRIAANAGKLASNSDKQEN